MEPTYPLFIRLGWISDGVEGLRLMAKGEVDMWLEGL